MDQLPAMMRRAFDMRAHAEHLADEGFGEDFFWRAGGDHAAPLQDRHDIAEHRGKVKVVKRHDAGGGQAAHQ